MLDKEIIEFLEQLKQNNTKEWFTANKPFYDKVKLSYEDFVKELIKQISTFDSEIAYLQPKDCTFRLYRDIRFSNDKTPFKTYFGAYIVKGGKKSGYSGYYFHLEPDNFFIAGGIYEPLPQALKEIREEIYANPDEILNILNEKKFKETYQNIWGEKLKNPPKGFDKSFEHIDLLKFKSYASFHQLTNDEIYSPNFLDILKNYFNATYSFNKYLNNIVANVV